VEKMVFKLLVFLFLKTKNLERSIFNVFWILVFFRINFALKLYGYYFLL